MVDVNLIMRDPDAMRAVIASKGVRVDLDEFLKLYEQRKELQQERDELNRKRNEHAKKLQGGKPDAVLVAEGKRLKEDGLAVAAKLQEIDSRYTELLLRMPNFYSADTPIGADDSGNIEIEKWGSVREFDFAAKDHVELGTSLDLFDPERGAKVAGARGYFLKNDAVLLEWALLSYCLEKMRAHGFTLFIPPTMVREMALYGSGHFPFLTEESYPVDDRFLVGTSEASLLAYRADEIIEHDELPLKYCAISSCFRREVGGYGKDTKGLYRVHEFRKVEQVIIAENSLDASLKLFESMRAVAEEILQDLKLPYRVLQICTGDMGSGKYKMYDIETWMPSRGAYGETHSCSHLTDWQSRRLKMRYRNASGELVYPYTMNNTVIASPRILIALLENYQEKNGTIMIPEVLQPYFRGKQYIGN